MPKFEFHTPESINREDPYRTIAELQRELNMMKTSTKLIEQMNPILDKAVTSDLVYKHLAIYISELLKILNKNDDIDIFSIKKYFEYLLTGTEVHIFIGMKMYDQIYSLSENRTLVDVHEINNLYDVRTTEVIDLDNLLKQVDSSIGFYQLSNVKIDMARLNHYTSVGVWTMDNLLEFTPGFVVFLARNKNYFTPMENEIISLFMQFIQPIIANKITISLLARETELAMKLSFTDSLTKLSNRAKFTQDYLNNNDNLRNTIVYLDLNRLKHINDTYGHNVADDVLVRLGSELDNLATRLNGWAYRLGGDEYVLQLPHNIEKDELKTKIETFREHFRNIQFYTNKDKTEEFTVDVSIGVATNSNLRLSASDTVRIADKLMYKSKRETNKVEYSWEQNNPYDLES